MKIKGLFSVAVPLLVMLAWVIKQEYDVRTATKIELQVEGYDPRDLLSGHYLQYRVVYGPEGDCKNYNPKGPGFCQCLQVAKENNIATSHWLGSCTERPADCNLWIEGACQWNQFDAGIERYYFPEKYKDVLHTIPPNSTIQIALRNNGSAIVTDFLVDGVALIEYAKKKKSLIRSKINLPR